MGRGLVLPAVLIAGAVAACSSADGHVSATTSVPAGSFVVDLSWLSGQRGWALIAAPCRRGLCPELARTTDGGRRWQALAALPATVSCRRVRV